MFIADRVRSPGEVTVAFGLADRGPHSEGLASVASPEGNEPAIFKAVFWHSLVLASLVGLLVMFYAYVVPQVIP